MPFVTLAVFFVLVVMVALTGMVFKPGDWYDGLAKPSWTPPDWSFRVVWSVLYPMIAVAGWLVWEAAGLTLATAFWIAQLVLNGAWSWLFFGRWRMDQAFADVVLLWLSILGFIITAWSISPLAALLFLPYLLWVTIAAALNRAVWQLNPQAMQG